MQQPYNAQQYTVGTQAAQPQKPSSFFNEHKFAIIISVILVLIIVAAAITYMVKKPEKRKSPKKHGGDGFPPEVQLEDLRRLQSLRRAQAAMGARKGAAGSQKGGSGERFIRGSTAKNEGAQRAEAGAQRAEAGAQRAEAGAQRRADAKSGGGQAAQRSGATAHTRAPAAQRTGQGQAPAKRVSQRAEQEQQPQRVDDSAGDSKRAVVDTKEKSETAVEEENTEGSINETGETDSSQAKPSDTNTEDEEALLAMLEN